MGLKWERVRSSDHCCGRAKVPGGWLVYIEHDEGGIGLTFYPDTEHRWEGGQTSNVQRFPPLAGSRP